MTPFTLTKTRFAEGVWEGVLTTPVSGEVTPVIECTHLEVPIDGVSVDKTGSSEWAVRIPVHANLIGDGVQTFLIRNAEAGETLAVFTLISGEVMADDIRAEMDLLRAELDMFKRAFRRHCLETL